MSLMLAIAVATAAPTRAADNSDAAHNLASRLGSAVEKCWIKSNDVAFADYIYSPEPNATNGPRILLVPRKNPAAAPALAIEINPAGEHVSVYGQLATSPQAGRIGTDLRRWIAGETAC
jgi:hypothetical protein